MDIVPTYPIYNQGYNPLTIRGMKHQVGSIEELGIFVRVILQMFDWWVSQLMLRFEWGN